MKNLIFLDGDNRAKSRCDGQRQKSGFQSQTRYLVRSKTTQFIFWSHDHINIYFFTISNVNLFILPEICQWWYMDHCMGKNWMFKSPKKSLQNKKVCS